MPGDLLPCLHIRRLFAYNKDFMQIPTASANREPAKGAFTDTFSLAFSTKSLHNRQHWIIVVSKIR